MEEVRDLIEYVEKIYPVHLSDFQKHFIKTYERARKENRKVFVTFPRMCGRKMLVDAIRKWENEINLVADEGKSTLLSNEEIARGSE